jgi:hypothetical protein
MHAPRKQQVEKANGKGGNRNQQQGQKRALIRKPARHEQAEAKG